MYYIKIVPNFIHIIEFKLTLNIIIKWIDYMNH